MNAALVRTLLDRATELAEVEPDRARDLLVEACVLAAAAEADDLHGQACELMGWIALSTGDLDQAGAPIQAAADAYAALGDRAGSARAAALQAFLATPHGFESDAALLDAEAEFAHTLAAPQADAATLAGQRALLDLRRGWPLADGTPSRAAQLAWRLGLSRSQTALVLLGACVATDPTLVAGLGTDPRGWHGRLFGHETASVSSTYDGSWLAGWDLAGPTGIDLEVATWLAGSDLPPPAEIEVPIPEPLDLTGDLADAWPDAVAAVERGQRLIIVGDRPAAQRVAAALAAEAGRPLWILPSHALGHPAARRTWRNAALCDVALAIDALTPDDPARAATLAGAPIALVSPPTPAFDALEDDVWVITLTGENLS